MPALTLRAQPARGSVQVIGFPRKTSESVVYQLSGTGFQDWNAVSVQRLLGGGVASECSLVFPTWWDGLKGGGILRILLLSLSFFCCLNGEQLHKHAGETREWPLAVIFSADTWLGTRCKRAPIVTSPHSLCPGAFVSWKTRPKYWIFAPQRRRLSERTRAEAGQQWPGMNDLFCFSGATK